MKGITSKDSWNLLLFRINYYLDTGVQWIYWPCTSSTDVLKDACKVAYNFINLLMDLEVIDTKVPRP